MAIGVCLAVSALPVLIGISREPAPISLSTMMGCPNARDMPSATRSIPTSASAPGENGSNKVIGRARNGLCKAKGSTGRTAACEQRVVGQFTTIHLVSLEVHLHPAGNTTTSAFQASNHHPSARDRRKG